MGNVRKHRLQQSLVHYHNIYTFRCTLLLRYNADFDLLLTESVYLIIIVQYCCAESYRNAFKSPQNAWMTLPTPFIPTRHCIHSKQMVYAAYRHKSKC